MVRGDGGSLVGVDAVVDKDYTAAALATAIGAQALVIMTAVEAVQVDFGTATPRRLGQIDVAQAEAHLAARQFPEGSMGPKIRAATQFLRRRRRGRSDHQPGFGAASLRCTDPDDLTVGTRIIRTGPPSEPIDDKPAAVVQGHLCRLRRAAQRHAGDARGARCGWASAVMATPANVEALQAEACPHRISQCRGQ